MRLRVLALVSACVAVLPASALAAMVSPNGGEVRVGTGQGFQLIVAPTEVAAGAQVMVSPKGKASIAYSDDCVVTAPAATITIIESRSPCRSLPEPSYFGFAQSNEEGIAIGEEAFGFTPKVDVPESTETAPAPAPAEETKETKTAAPVPVSGTNKKEPAIVYEEKRPEDHHSLLVVGGVVLGAGALAAILASQGSDGPASP